MCHYSVLVNVFNQNPLHKDNILNKTSIYALDQAKQNIAYDYLRLYTNLLKSFYRNIHNKMPIDPIDIFQSQWDLLKRQGQLLPLV